MSNPSPSGPSRKILVIDDSPIIQRTMYFALRDQGYTVLMCGEISEAFKIIRHERLDAILLDLNFPLDDFVGKSANDGFGVLGQLRCIDEAKQIPVIIISSDPPEKSKAQALAAGAAAYFHKPVDKSALAASIAELIAQKPTASPT
jgi:CheY-like chemotaxis protein